uniref:Ribosomal protein L6 n=1 Tax=Entomoneis sp. TaxID=186043 RepID=A0A3G1PWC5_9STRA|nr:ribosomal protein L6 [Entomoneis sp.]
MIFKKNSFGTIYSIKIPNNISIFYFKTQNIIIFKTKSKKRFLMVDPRLNFLILKNRILVFINSLTKISNTVKKQLISLKKTIFSFFKHFLIEIQINLYSKLKLIGIGYKIFKTNYDGILSFKLGYSHSIYFKPNLKTFILKATKLFIVGNLYQNSTKVLSLIRTLKVPEPYKGKGILYENEKITLKEGKKT